MAKSINFPLSISSSTISSYTFSKKVSTTVYEQQSTTAVNQSIKINTTKDLGHETRPSQAWKTIAIALGVVTLLIIATVMLIKYIKARYVDLFN